MALESLEGASVDLVFRGGCHDHPMGEMLNPKFWLNAWGWPATYETFVYLTPAHLDHLNPCDHTPLASRQYVELTWVYCFI